MSSTLNDRSRHIHCPLMPRFAGADNLAFIGPRCDITSSTPTQQESPISSAASAAELVAASHDSFVHNFPVTIGVSDLWRNSHLGQITPPEDNWKVGRDIDNDADGLASETNVGIDYAMPSDKTAKSSAQRRHSEQSSTSSSKPANGRRVDKRDKYREKNRVAAAKCRAKKKDHIDGLEETHRTQSMLNALLKHTEQNLRNELSFWKTQALQHAFCECKAVQDYIVGKARDLTASEYLDSIAPRGIAMASVSPPTQIDSAIFGDDKDVGSPTE